jgi:hypothetical protein
LRFTFEGSPPTPTTDRLCLPLVQQCIDLAQGFSRIAFGVEPADRTGRLDAFLPNHTDASTGDQINARLQASFFFAGTWIQAALLPPIFGQLFTLQTQRSDPRDWCVHGIPFPVTRPVQLVPGFNRIGYTRLDEVPLIDALRFLPASNNDEIIAPLEKGPSNTQAFLPSPLASACSCPHSLSRLGTTQVGQPSSSTASG